MNLGEIENDGLVLLGCGKMGSALLRGWLDNGINPASVWVVDPNPSDWLQSLDVHLNAPLPDQPALVLVAVKPQMIRDAVPDMDKYANGKTVFLSIAAGTTLATFANLLRDDTPVIRAMPNTPAAVGRGITALVGNSATTEANLAVSEALLAVVGQTVQLDSEADMDAVTALSGSGPAYVFHLIETLALAGEAEGLAPDLALRLARATVAGAGELAEKANESPAQLRINVTSPAGTTAAALDVLMDEDNGFPALLRRAVAAAAKRSRELGK